nr:hypothetical protein [Pandoravirus massiliensis]
MPLVSFFSIGPFFLEILVDTALFFGWGRMRPTLFCATFVCVWFLSLRRLAFCPWPQEPRGKMRRVGNSARKKNTIHKAKGYTAEKKTTKDDSYMNLQQDIRNRQTNTHGVFFVGESWPLVPNTT